MALIDVESVSKAFQIPSVRRETVREHLPSVRFSRAPFRLGHTGLVFDYDLGAGVTYSPSPTLVARNGVPGLI